MQIPYVAGGRVNGQKTQGGQLGKAVIDPLTQISALGNLSDAYACTIAKVLTKLLCTCVPVCRIIHYSGVSNSKISERIQRSVNRGLIRYIMVYTHDRKLPSSLFLMRYFLCVDMKNPPNKPVS